LADWQEIVREHGPMAFDTAWRLLGNASDTEDAVQEALLDAFRLQRRQAIANWGGLLRHLATRRALDRLRKRRPLELLPSTALSPPGDRPDEQAIERELSQRLREALSILPDREASVFSLRYFAEMQNSEIAATLQISPEAVAAALHKARRKLQERLEVEPLVSRRARND